MERIGLEARHRAARGDRRRAWRSRSPSSSARSTRTPGMSSRSARPQQLGERVLRQARADQEAPQQDRVLHRRPRPRPATRRAPDHRAGSSMRELTKLKSTYLDALPALLAGRRRIHATFNQVGGGDRPALEHEPEPPEHPDAVRGRAARSAMLHRRAGSRLLSADYAQIELRVLAHDGGEPVLREPSPPARTSTRPRRPGSSAPTGRGRRPPSGRSEDGQLRDRLRALGLRPGRPAPHPPRGGRRPTSTPTSSASRRSRIHRRDDRARRAARAT